MVGLRKTRDRNDPRPSLMRLRKPWYLWARDFIIAAAACAIIAVGIDGICYLILGETSAGTWYDKYWMGFFFCCSFIISCFYILRDKIADEPEYVYLAIVLIVGLFMAWSLSVFIVGWDTGIHFKAVLDFADIDGEFELSPSEMAYAATDFSFVAGDYTFDLAGLYHLKGSLNYHDVGVFTIVTEPSAWSIFNGINYVPCAIVMFICEHLGLSFEAKHFLSVLPCVFIYAFVTFFGMRKLRSGKMLYAVIALFPTVVFLAANYGYQYWNISLFLYGFASLASFFQRQEAVPASEMVKMLVAFALACMAKIAYAPLILLSLIVPKRCFSSKKACYLYRGGVLLVTGLVALIFFIPILSSGLGEGDKRGGGDINPSAQLSFILSNPVDYAMRVIDFLTPPYLWEDGSIRSGFLSFTGACRVVASFGYLPRIPLFYPVLVLLLLAFTTFTDKNERAAYGVIPAVACITVSVINIILIVTYMILIFNNVGNITFQGIQSRYLLPFIFPTLAFLGSRKWGLNGSIIPSRVYNSVVLALMAFVLMASWWQCYVMSIF